MIPGFVNIYKDNENFIHLYFFNGIDDNEKRIYKNIDLSNIPFKFSYEKNEYYSEYKFENKSIVKINCKLVPFDSNIETKNITVRI